MTTELVTQTECDVYDVVMIRARYAHESLTPSIAVLDAVQFLDCVLTLREWDRVQDAVQFEIDRIGD